MADCVIAKITENLVSAFNGKTITWGGASHVLFSEEQRLEYNPNGNDDYLEVCGPWPEKMDESGNRTEHVKLNYIAEYHISNVNDKPPSDPIVKQTKNVGAELVKLALADLSRGSNAHITRIDGQPGYYIQDNGNGSEFVIYVNISVEAFINADDPYLIA